MMTLGSDSPASDTARAWGAEILDAPPDAPQAELSAAFLRRLVEEDFVPPPILRMAWETAVRNGAERHCTERHRAPAFDAYCEERLTVEIEQFAAQFFSLPQAERIEIWKRLFTRAEAFPRCLLRLKSLQPGLKVELSDGPPLEPNAALLAKSAAELFVLRPSQRAVRRRELMRSRLTGDDARWQAAALLVQKQLPEVAALAPEFIDLLVRWQKTSKLATNNRRKRLAQVPAKTISNGGSKRSMTGVAIAIAIGLSALGRSLTDNNSNRRSPVPTYYGPSYQSPIDPGPNAPSYPPPSGDGTNSRSATEAINQLIRRQIQDRLRRSGQGTDGPKSPSPDGSLDPPASPLSPEDTPPRSALPQPSASKSQPSIGPAVPNPGSARGR